MQFYTFWRPLGTGCVVADPFPFESFFRRTGLKTLEPEGQGWDVPTGILCMVIGCFTIYSALFAVGNWIYGKKGMATLLTCLFLVSLFILNRAWKKLRVLV